MKKQGILHPALNRVLSETGHTDMFTVCDRGFPVPIGIERIDLALSDNIPTVLDVLRAVDQEFVIDFVIVAEEMIAASPERYEEMKREFPHLRLETIPHVQFKEVGQESRAVVRTGDTAPYANIMIVSG